jgi:hypothetical protein
LDVAAHQIKAAIEDSFKAYEYVVHFLILPAISSNWTATSSGLCCLLFMFLPRLWFNSVMLSLWSAPEITNPTLLASMICSGVVSFLVHVFCPAKFGQESKVELWVGYCFEFGPSQHLGNIRSPPPPLPIK